ncbi:MAG: hypothetical protein EOO01_42245, partial [Chitinophagaceae bacterium]
QAAELAKNFLGLAQAIGNYRFVNWKKLSKAQNEELADKQWSILNAGEDMLALSTTLVFEKAEVSIKQIRQVTADVDKTILTIKRIQKVIDIGAAVVQLAALIIAKQPLAIPGAIDNLVKTIK